MSFLEAKCHDRYQKMSSVCPRSSAH